MATVSDNVDIETICSPELRALATECPESVSDEELFALLNSGPTASAAPLEEA